MPRPSLSNFHIDCPLVSQSLILYFLSHFRPLPFFSVMQKILCPLAAFCLSASLAGCSTVLAPPGQPRRKGVLNSFELVGDSLVSAQQVCYLRTHYPVQHVLRRRLEAIHWYSRQDILC